MLLIFLYREDLLDEVLEALIELEIVDACVLRATAMERILAEDVPIFSGLLQTLGDSHDRVDVILAPFADRDQVPALFRLLRANGADLADPSIGRLHLLPVETPTPPSD